MQVTLQIEDSYANGDSFTRTDTVTVDAPPPGVDLVGWADDTFFEFTGQGSEYTNIDSLHDVTVLACAELPELVGLAVHFG